jgi:hypothetical protein
MATERGHFVFCFHDADHRGEWDDNDEADQWYIQAAANEQWVLQKTGGPDDFKGEVFEGVDTLDRLQADFRADMGEAPPQVIDIPFEKLKALMAEGGWRFVGGAYSFGEGFDDVGVEVVLER